ncbi:effector binding domain-containing protein [Paenibacillus chartarius]|uniref:Effector binding domain-containing protein n=1 Tax=Paenibacillus chartarius TaxID=747481 RepID=A0ABV6DGJ3_9BACL
MADYYTRMQQAIDYIESRLTEDLKIADVAARAHCSAFHFQRLFQAITGFSVQGYVRKRRLSEAAGLLRSSQKGILDVAVEYGYGSQEAFTRAFSSFFGMTPAQYRKSEGGGMMQGKVDFHEWRSRASEEGRAWEFHKPTIETRQNVTIIGYAYKTSLEEERYYHDIPEFYRAFGAEGKYLRIPYRRAPDLAYGISCGFEDDGTFLFVVGEEVEDVWGDEGQADGSFGQDTVGRGATAERYAASDTATEGADACDETKALDEGFVRMTLPAGTYAHFRAHGSVDFVQDTRRFIYRSWLPNSNYERAEGPDFEVTDVRSSRYPDMLRIDIYIPLK